MKTKLLTKLHEKCIGILELIDRAEFRRNEYTRLIVRKQMTTPQNELQLWYMGAPKWNELNEGLAKSQAVLTRLENYYINTLSKIEKHAVSETA